MARKVQVVAVGANDNVISDVPVHAAAALVGTSSATLVAAPTSSERRYLLIQNQHATQDIYVRLDGATATADANSLKIPAGTSREWSGNYVPNGTITAIALGASTPVAVVTG